jgi:hypothetical protein
MSGSGSALTRVLSVLLGLALAGGVFLPAAQSVQATAGEELPAGLAAETQSARSLFDGVAGPVAGPMIFFCGALAFFLSAFGLQRLCLAPSAVAVGLIVLSIRIVSGEFTVTGGLPAAFLPAPGGESFTPVGTAWIWLSSACAGLAILALVDISRGRKGPAA